jgi:hypothetical protein
MAIRTPGPTKRLVLRPWQESDRQPFAALSTDPEVMRNLMPLVTRAASDAWIDRQQAHCEHHGFCMWAVSPGRGYAPEAAAALAFGFDVLGWGRSWRIPYRTTPTPSG